MFRAKYAFTPDETWADCSVRVPKFVMGSLYQTDGARSGGFSVSRVQDATERVSGLMNKRMFCPGGRYLYATGRDLHQTQNCLLLKPEDTRESWSELMHNSAMALMTGAGIGAWYGAIRAAGTPIRRTGGVASGPLSVMHMVNEEGRHIMQGGSRRSAIWAGLPWWHPDIFTFIRSKDWPEWLREQKAKDLNTPAPLDMTNISVSLDDAFFEAYGGQPWDESFILRHGTSAPDGTSWCAWARRVYEKTVDKMLTTAEPGFTVDCGDKSDEVLRNACTEITSADDSDVCNLGGLVLSRFSDPEQFGAAVRDAALFLTAGTIYSDLPYQKVYDVREKNRRLGLSVLGVHEFCVRNGVRYGTDECFEVLEPYMTQYDRALEWANELQDELGLSRSVGATCAAPQGTTGIAMETSTSWEPFFAAAFKRRLRNADVAGDRNVFEYVVDPTVARLVAEGVDPSLIEDSYELAYDYERRFRMQEYAQSHIDHAISMTVNLPKVMRDPGEQATMRDTLIKYLPKLRGITMYPDGCRPGQPLTHVPLEYALEQQGVRFEEKEDRCVGGVCAS